jgi:mono/diheme cytochrome c family protein
MRRAALVTVLVAVLAVAGCGGGGDDETTLRTGRQIYVALCQTCHGRSGGGFVGPSLVDVAEQYPDVDDQIAVVTNGQAAMPGFSSQLSAAQIEKVVEYTRSEFSTAPATTTTVAGPTLPPNGDDAP